MRIKRGLCLALLALLLMGSLWAQAKQPAGYMLYQQPGAYSLLVPSGSRHYRKADMEGPQDDNLMAYLSWNLAVPNNIRYFVRKDSNIALAAMLVPSSTLGPTLLFDSIIMPIQFEANKALQPDKTWTLSPPYAIGPNRWRRIDGVDDPVNPREIISYLYMLKDSQVCVLMFVGMLSGQDTRETYEDIINQATESFRISAALAPPAKEKERVVNEARKP